MELKKLVLATAMFSALGGLYGCSGDETVDIVIDAQDNSVDNSVTTSTSNTGGSTGGGSSIIDLEGGGVGPNGCPAGTFANTVDGREGCELDSPILSNITLTADTAWFLRDAVVVGDGNQRMLATDGQLESGGSVTNVVMTIQPGTKVFGVDGTFANLTVTRGSRLIASGTEANPIIFSSSDAGTSGSGEWGGLILHGYGLHNECRYVGDGVDPAITADAACNVDAEGESGFAGGHNEEDNSGVLRYVVVAEGGFEFSTGNEINGISFVGVGGGTTVDYIQVTGNADDGVEFYGGAVDASHLVLTGNDDDSIDWDEGYIGNIQYAFVTHVTDGGDFTIEADTEGTLSFLSEPTILNATFVSSGVEEAAHNMKASTGGYIHNSVITNVDGTTPLQFCVNLGGSGVATNVTNGDLVYNNIVADCVAFETSDGSTASTTLGTTTVSVVSDVTFNTNWGATNTEAAGFAFVEADITGASPVVDASFFDITTYAGAVDPAATSAWFSGWTLDGTVPTAP